MPRTLRRHAGGRRLLSFAVSLGLVVFMVVCRGATAEAATTTITVSGTGDSPTISPCTTTCPTLRDAVAEANSLTTDSGSPVTIVLPAGTTGVSAGAITLGSATNLDFTLTGPTANASGAVIQATGSPANQGQGVLVVQTVDSAVSTFENLTITGGDADSGTFGGGAILTGWNNQTTTVTNCVFTSNTSAAAAGGGAIAMEGGPIAGASLTVTGSTFTGNSTSAGPGGAILAENNAGSTGQVTLTNDTFSNNTAASPAANGGAFGGAVQVVSASLSMSKSFFQANVAENSGGGTPVTPASGGALYVASAASASITTSTFVNNSTSAGGHGGAIFNNTTQLSMTFSRLVGNTSNGGSGDAVVNETNGGSVTATENWWGQNSGPSANEVNSGSSGAAPPTTSPNLQLRLTASPPTLNVGGSSALTADLFLLSSGATISPGSLNGLAGFGGTLNGRAVTFVNGSATGTFTATTAGTFSVSATADNQTVSTTITVQATPLPVTISGSQTFGSSSPAFTAAPTSGSLPPGVSLSGTPTCTTVESGTPIGPSLAAGSYMIDGASCSGLSLSGPNAGDYALSFVGGTFTVNPQPLPVTVTGAQTFGSSSPVFTAVPTSGSLPPGVTLSGTPTCTTVNSGTAIAPSLAAGSYTVDASSCSGLSLSGANAGDYTLSLVGGTFTVSPQPVSVTVSGGQTFGSSSPTFTAVPTSGSLPSGVTLSGTPTCTTVNAGTPIGPSLAAGSYTIDPASCSGLSLSGANAGDYALSLAGGTFVVSVAPLSVTISGTQTFGSSSPAFSAAPTAGSLPSGVTFSGTPVCTTVNSGTPIGPSLAAASYTIDASSCSGLSLTGANAGDYVLSLAGGTFTVTPAMLSVTVSGSQTFGSSSPTFTAVPTSGSLPAGVTLSGMPTCTTVNSGTPIGTSLPPGSYTIDAASCSGLSLSGPNAADYTLSLVAGTFTVSPQSLSVTVTGNQTFGSSSPSFVAVPTSGSLPAGVSLSGIVTCATVDSGTPVGPSLPAGSFTVDGASCSGLSLSGPNAGDYALSLVGGTFTVSPQSLSVTVSGNQTFGASAPTFTAVPTSGSLPAGVSLSGVVTCTTVDSGTPIGPSLPAGSYTIDAASCSGLSLSGSNAGDYALSLAGGTFTDSPATLQVSISGTQTFGSSSPAFTASPASGSLPSGVTLSGTVTCTRVTTGATISASLPAGTYIVDATSCSGLTLAGANAGDYTPALTGGPFVVSQSGSAIAVAFAPQNPTAGQTVTFTVTVTGDPPTGTVTFKLGTSTLGTAQLDSAGQARFSTSSLPVGTDTVTVSYSGDRSFAPASTTVTIQVAALPPSSSAGTAAGGSSTTTSGTTPGLPATGINAALAALPATPTGGALTFLGGLLLLVLIGTALLLTARRRRMRLTRSSSQ